MRIIAVDDEPMALELLVSCIQANAPAAEVKAFCHPKDALRYGETQAVDVAFLDIHMRGMSGIEAAKQLKRLYPKTNIVFTTGYSEYAVTAFQLNASDYLLKPITSEDVRHALDHLRHPVPKGLGGKLWIQAFGNFDVFWDGEPVHFQYDKTKELLAYLTDRNGSMCTNRELMAALWEDDSHASYLKRLRKDLSDTLRALGCEDALEKQWGSLRLVKDQVDCDYYQWLAGRAEGINAYRGEYMTQYSWSESTQGTLFAAVKEG